MIDWWRIAKQNGMSFKEFSKEIIQTAAVIGSMMIDDAGEGDTLRFKYSDNAG